MRKRPSIAKMQKRCDAFNAVVKVGDPVTCVMDSGEHRQTVTTSEAQILSGHTPVVWMKGISGCYLLDRVTPRTVKGEQQ